MDRIKHLGNTITNGDRVLEEDMNQKKAKYINRNCEINQELHFSDMETKLLVNDLYNSSWFGSVLWDLYGSAATKIESCYN